MTIRTTLTVAAVSLGLTLAGATAASAAGPDDAQRAGQGGPAADAVCELTGEPADQVRDQLRAADGTGAGRQTRQHAQLAV